MVQKPFYDKNGSCEVYIIHPPGGIVGGDELTLTVDVGRDAHALVTVPAATKFYRSAGSFAHTEQQFAVEEDGILEWLPQETIVYQGALASSRTRVQLAPGAHFCGWEVVCLGRPAAGEGFERGTLASALHIDTEEGPLWRERLHLNGGEELLSAPYGMRGEPVTGTLTATLESDAERRLSADAVRDVIGERADFSVTELDHLLVCRYLGPSAQTARQLFERVWKMWRPLAIRKEAVAPRIWAT